MKILEISGKLNIGGAQSVAASIANYADEKYSFVYVVFGDEIGEYEAEIAAKGNKIIHIPSPSENHKAYFKTLLKIMREEEIDVVHCHTMFNCGVVMLAAKIAGVKGRISHSHTIKDESRMTAKRRIYIFAMRILMYLFGTDYFACGVDAGRILYGEKWFNKHGTVIRNGIDIEKYRFSRSRREELRKQYGLENNFVIGHVGHYIHVKNQKFLIDLMPDLLKIQPDAKLLMFGDGPDRQKLQNAICKNGLEGKAFLMGNADNIHELLSAFDVFAFPSFYEGTPLALIEAQANGAPCVISDTIPADACLTDTIEKLPLENGSLWTDKLISAKRNNPEIYADVLMERYGDIRKSVGEMYTAFDKYR